jgi:hypothetical protein
LSGDRPKTDGPPSTKAKPQSYKQYGVGRLVDHWKDARAAGHDPAPLDEPYKRRFGDVYEAHVKAGRDVDALEGAIAYVIRCAYGGGEGWLEGKKRLIPLVDAVAYADREATSVSVGAFASPEAEAEHYRQVEENERELARVMGWAS